MAQKNRTEVKTEVTNEISSTVTIAKHTGMLNNSLVESAVFRKDVVNTGTGSGAQVLNYLDYDQIVFTATGNVTFSFSNLNDGDRVKLVVIKSSSDIVAFSGVTGEMAGQEQGLTSVSYAIEKLGALTYVSQINRQTSGVIGLGDISNGTDTNCTIFSLSWEINDRTVTVQGATTVASVGSTSTLTINLPAGVFNPRTVYSILTNDYDANIDKTYISLTDELIIDLIVAESATAHNITFGGSFLIS